MTRERLEELNEAWGKIDSIVPVINLLSNIEEGGTIQTDGIRTQISPELVRKFAAVAWDCYYELYEKFKEM